MAREWLAHVPMLEGVVAKRVDGRYRPGTRGWVKVKGQQTADCVVAGFAGSERTPALVLALRDSASQLRTFGVTRPIAENLAEPVLKLLGRAGPAQSPRARWPS